MPALQVKDCPPDLYERLRACAQEENRSISQQTVTILRDYLDARDDAKVGQVAAEAVQNRNLFDYDPYSGEQDSNVDYLARHRAAVERLNELPPIPVTDETPSTVEILRQIREEEAR